MTISIGEAPEPGIYNKFLGKLREGHRGIIVAINDAKTEAIILAMTTSAEEGDGVRWGKFYLVREIREDQYPYMVESVSEIPDSEEWSITLATSPQGDRQTTSS